MTGLRSLLAAGLLALALVPRAAGADAPAAYDTFVSGASAQHGLFTLWHKDGKLYVELAPGQVGHDFVQTIVPSSGTGGDNVVWGNTDYFPASLVRFERAGNSIAILWPNPFFVAPHSAASARAIERNFPRSIVALAPIVAEDKDGRIVFDAASFLDDQMNLRRVLKDSIGGAAYALDKDRTYFGSTKAFPKNVVIEALQAWTSDDQRLHDVAPDPHHLQLHVTYNIADAPGSPDYRPRYADDRIGTYDDVYLSFDDDEVLTRVKRYVVRWNLQPSDPSKRLSPAKHPMIFTLSDTIPERYRPVIRAAVLKWNAAFERIGISNAIQVVDQPNDPEFDPDDIRYNMLRWVAEYHASFGADSQTLYDPRTGEEFRTGVLISADIPLNTLRTWREIVDPVRYGRSSDPMPRSFVENRLTSDMLHETGHNMGLQHNFIGSRAYTMRQLQDAAFTARNGTASTVMEYQPLNLWPRGTPNGVFDQTVLGPYDYYAARFLYAAIPGANTPEDELPTLRKWASAWSDPRYRFASDEDTSWADGHASDPRVEQGILSSDPLGWCAVQLPMYGGLMRDASRYFPASGDAYEGATDAFEWAMRIYDRCSTMPGHFIGGQYLSRAHRGDPHADPPIVPVPFVEQRRAFDLMSRYLFAPGAWRMPPGLLQHLAWSEWAGYGYGDYAGDNGALPQWAYTSRARHDFDLAGHVSALQHAAIAHMFQPAVLARLNDGASESTERRPMRLADLFDWMDDAVFSEFAAPARTVSIDPMRRALQTDYEATLIGLVTKPAAGTPSDAQALARAALARIAPRAERAARATVDETTRAHLELLAARAREALEPR